MLATRILRFDGGHCSGAAPDSGSGEQLEEAPVTCVIAVLHLIFPACWCNVLLLPQIKLFLWRFLEALVLERILTIILIQEEEQSKHSSSFNHF